MDWTALQPGIARLLDQPGLTLRFTWNYRPYTGARAMLKREAVNIDRGLEGQYEFSVLCATAQFKGVYPRPRQDKVMVDGRELRVLSTDFDPVTATVRLNLGSLVQ